MSLYTFPFDSTEKPEHDRLGGKCTSLAIMTGAGMPVPPGFAVTTESYDAASDSASRATSPAIFCGWCLSVFRPCRSPAMICAW